MENGTASQAKGYNLRNKKHPSDKLLEVHVGGRLGVLTLRDWVLCPVADCGSLFFQYSMGLPWRRLVKYAPSIPLLPRRNMPGEVLLPLSTPQGSGGERLTNLTALFRSLISSVISPPCPYSTSPVMLGGLDSESSGLVETAQGGGWSCSGERLCILIGRGPSSRSPRGLT